jgi:hypothetical protein
MAGAVHAAETSSHGRRDNDTASMGARYRGRSIVRNTLLFEQPLASLDAPLTY